jgi:hypothetical protein
LIKKSVPENLWASIGLTGHTGQTNSIMSMIAHLNFIYLRWAHKAGLEKWKELYGTEMPQDQVRFIRS